VPDAANIAVFLPSWVGDAVMATPALRAIRAHFAGSTIVHVGRAGPLEVLDGAGLRDATVEDVSHKRPRLGNMLRTARLIRRHRCALGVLLPNSFRSALLAKLGRVPRLAGYSRDGRGWLLNDRLDPPRDRRGRLAVVPAIDYYNALAALVGAPVESSRMSLSVSPEAAAAADDLLRRAGVGASGPVVMLNPGGSFGPSKLWPAERYAALADMLVCRAGARIIVNAAPGEGAIAASVAAAMSAPPDLDMSLQANSISLVKALMARCRVLVTNDTGARHVAAALGVGVVTVFGSTDPARTVIDYPRERAVWADVPCRPCQRKTCPKPPGEEFHQCMRAVTVERVFAAASELLDAPADGEEDAD
jgi:heptosyltransferase-2